ncbi:MAG: GntR family transcriptional regulator [Lachnospiraceae bacterium]
MDINMRILKYKIIEDYIKNEVISENLKNGDKIYSESQLMVKFNVSRHTVREAINRLAQEGIIYTEHGRGSFVNWQNTVEKTGFRTSKIIVVIVSYLNNHIIPDIIQKIEEMATEKGYNIMIRCTHNQIAKERECLLDLMNKNVFGIIAEPAKSALPSPNACLYQQFREKGIPVIFIHGYLSQQTDDYVVVDDEAAAYNATEYLIRHGHTQISGVFKSDDIQGVHRYSGMIKAMLENDISINENNILWLSTQDEKYILKNKVLVDQIFSRLKNTTATICYNDDLAITVADKLFEQHVKIPEEHSIISFDNTPFGDAYRVAITSMDHPKGKLGKAAFESLVCLIEKKKEKIQVSLEVELIEKESVQFI